MNNVEVWKLYQSDDSDDLNEEDLLAHYRQNEFYDPLTKII